MSDYAFDTRFVPMSGAAKVERMSVLWPVIGRRSYSVEHVTEDIDAVLYRWRRRLSALFRRGRDVIPSDLQLQLMRNCHPAGAATSVVGQEPEFTAWRCNVESFCPWDWARRAGETYQEISRRLPERMSKDKPTHALYLLTERVSEEAGGWGDRRLHEFLAYGAWKLSEALRRSKAVMGVRLSTLEPWSSRKEVKRWVFRHRLLLLYRTGSRVPASVVGDRKGVVVDTPERKDLQNVVARFFRYPVGLLKGPLDMVPAALKAREGLRLCEHSGALRKPPKSKG